MKTASTTPLYTLKKLQSELPKVKITSAESADKFIRQFYLDDIEIFESFFILMLDRANNTIGYVKISSGGLIGSVVDTKLVAKYCVETLAQSVILAHNHPSGTLKPSEADIKITKSIKNTLALFDCNVFDHIILTSDSFYSFANEGAL